MRIYRITRNGFVVAQANGKNKAINILKSEMAWDGVPADQAMWGKFIAGVLKVTFNDHIFTIEEAKA